MTVVAIVSRHDAVVSHPRHISPSTVIIASTLLIFCSFSLFVRMPHLRAAGDWDILIFTQRWPNTVCMTWEEQSPGHSCNLPKTPHLWTIHGIWPSKFGQIGPQFCNKTVKYNETALDDLKDELDEYWTDIEGTGDEGFWKHEWLKHGTCAMTDKLLTTERAYFQQGLAWSKQYNVIDILDAAQVLPGDNNQAYNVTVIAQAVQKATGKAPRIQCINDVKTGLPFLFEVRICFDKNLTLVDCYGTRGSESNWLYGGGNRRWAGAGGSKVVTNCPLNKPVMYPGSVPSANRRRALFDDQPQQFLVTFYKTLKLLIWASL